jgi:hypothetical protein
VRDLARRMSTAALRRLEQLGRMMHEPGPAVRANVAILDRAWGHPKQEIDLDVGGRSTGPVLYLPVQERDELDGSAEQPTHQELADGQLVPLVHPAKEPH